eukprot:CAMPEP_0201917494 /NCGR_PEP_ID=MMETSP0903-20130614/6878_1 /ASSEMBLY_ACC=CAM_ASM_000552 /TAXON_ID=420261 /ORGANISM="Thalassiosira antarctica, Strain CCMP982" /LENGTH=298 /DNA_ID=CAMNT_0048453571 /DNA_START=31 /DNA_END=927 /DNA_ORIENTATION=+
MAKAAYTAAVAQMEKQDKNKRNPEEVESDRENDSLARGGSDGVAISRPAKFLKVHGDGTFSDTSQNNDAGRENDVGARIEEIWKSGTNKTEDKFSETLRLLVGELDSIVQCGLGAFYDLDTTSRQLIQSKELAETRSREAQRLHAIDEQSRASLSNLLRAVESSKAEARDSSRSAQLEARLRTDISSLRDERDKATMELSDYRRKLSLFEEELRLTKSKLSRVMQEKISMERDSRAAISLARSLDNNNSNDMNYYKRKVSELSDKLQTQQDLISKQMNTISQLRAQQEHSTSQKRESY